MSKDLHVSLQSNKKQPGVSDFILLHGSGKDDTVTEDSFLENLKQRFNGESIYTYIGSVVVSVNPFKPLSGLYGPEAMAMYKNRYYYEVPPHVCD